MTKIAINGFGTTQHSILALLRETIQPRVLQMELRVRPQAPWRGSTGGSQNVFTGEKYSITMNMVK